MHTVEVFFYGSYINFDVLSEAGIDKRPFVTGQISGLELRIAPLANLVKNEHGTAFGILTRLTHEELERLYSDHALKILGGEYLPEAVIVHAADLKFYPALCYLAPQMLESRADPEYVDRILIPSLEYGFPEWYLDHIKSFKEPS